MDGLTSVGGLDGVDAGRVPARPVTRFAPSITGRLHLGHVVNAAWTWAFAQAFGGRVILRLEDHDRGRWRPEYERAILEDLEWLGLVPDEGPVRQSDRAELHERALAGLAAHQQTYPCSCTRKDILERTGEVDAGELRYDGHCRDRGLTPGPGRGLRLVLEDSRESFPDILVGEQRQRPAAQCGDLLLRDRNGDFTYHFAVTVDDDEQGVDLVVRGRDLLDSTGRQIALARALGRTSPPALAHHPLVTDDQGAKLSKSDSAAGLAVLRAEGMTPNQVLGHAARLGGLQDDTISLEAQQLGALLQKWLE